MENCGGADWDGICLGWCWHIGFNSGPEQPKWDGCNSV